MSKMDSFKYMEDILLGPMRSRALLLAIKLQIFELLQECPLTTQEISHRLKVKNTSMFAKLMHVLQCMNLICFDGKTYCNSEITHAIFSSGQENNFAAFFCFLAEEIESRSTADLFFQIKENQTPETPEVSFAEWQLYMQAMDDVAMLSAEVIAQTIDLKNMKTLCDMGSGPGTYAFAFARTNPKLQITLFDVEPSLIIAKQNLADNKFSDQFQFVEGSVLDEDWGGPYDAIFLSHVIHLFRPTEVLHILQTARRSLTSQGKLWIRDLFLNTEKTFPELGVLLSLCVWTEGGAYSKNLATYLLGQAGFDCVRYIKLDAAGQFPKVVGNLLEASTGHKKSTSQV